MARNIWYLLLVGLPSLLVETTNESWLTMNHDLQWIMTMNHDLQWIDLQWNSCVGSLMPSLPWIISTPPLLELYVSQSLSPLSEMGSQIVGRGSVRAVLLDEFFISCLYQHKPNTWHWLSKVNTSLEWVCRGLRNISGWTSWLQGNVLIRSPQTFRPRLIQ